MFIKVLILVPLPCKVSPSQRFRVELYESAMSNQNIEYSYAPFITKKFYENFYTNGFLFIKIRGVINGFFNRIKLMFSLKKYDYILIHREASLLGPPIFEWIIAKIAKKKIIYDFDDAIWLEQDKNVSSFKKLLKCYWKIGLICKWSNKVSAGNDYLVAFAKKYNNNVVLNPTCVDTIDHHNIIANQLVNDCTICWTGSFSTLPFLKLILPVLQELEKEISFKFLVICNINPKCNLKNYEFVQWSEKNEIEALAKGQIGIMPMKKDEWNLGKCGFKIIQYMALGIVPVADDWGVNNTIINNNINGILVYSFEDWYNKLKLLLTNLQLRSNLADKAIVKINNQFSKENNEEKFIQLFS